MLTYQNDPTSKAMYVARMDDHERADDIIQGYGWSGGEHDIKKKGCAIGCMFHVYDHELGSRKLDVPESFLHMIDAIHEGLPLEDAKKWPGRVLRAIPVGVDLTHICDQQAVLRMDRLLTLDWIYEDDTDDIVDIIEQTRALLVSRINGQKHIHKIYYSLFWGNFNREASTEIASAHHALMMENVYYAEESIDAAAECAEDNAEWYRWEAETLLTLLATARPEAVKVPVKELELA